MAEGPRVVAPRTHVALEPAGVSAWLAFTARGAFPVYKVQEVYPDVAVQVEVLCHRVLVHSVLRRGPFVYGLADAVKVISAGMEANLRAKRVPAAELHLIRNMATRHRHASSLADIRELISACGVVGAAAGSLFVFRGI